ncbi:MAG: hypothetical protein RL367_2124 [Pseudomonadota bacterium]
MRLWVCIAVVLTLGGCIPPAPDFSRDAPPPGPGSPTLATDTDGIFGDRPVWDATPVVANGTQVNEDSYIVLPGESLSAIGEKTGAGLAAIAAANALAPPYIIHPGQRLTIPTGKYHRVQPGETGIAIARAYAVPWARIVEANQLVEPFILKIGQRLRIPGGGSGDTVAAASLEQRAAAFKLNIDDILTGGEPAESADALGHSLPDAAPKRPLPPTLAVVGPSSLSGSFGWPATGRLVGRFGAVGMGERNDGIEIAVAAAAPVSAAADGVVAFVGDGVASYGGMVLIRHGSGWISAYGRIASASVTRGQRVRRGQIIGRAGTGTAPQLHFQLRRDRKPVDPLAQLPPR